jgi:preprotein translocase subunit YajC
MMSMSIHSPELLSILSAGAAAASPPMWVNILPFAGIAVIMWFMVLRPQMQQQKEQKAKLEGIKKGDSVVTGGGLLGKVTKVEDQYVEVELAPNVRVKAVKSMVSDVIAPGGAKAAND